MTRVTFEPPLYWHMLHVADNMRPDDQRELRDVAGTDPWLALWQGITAPGEAFTALWRGEPVALFGCGTMSILPPTGSPWLLGTPKADRLALPLLREARATVARWRARYALLENVVDGRNDRTVRWLAALGFSFDAPVVMPSGAQAMRFWQEGAICAT